MEAGCCLVLIGAVKKTAQVQRRIDECLGIVKIGQERDKAMLVTTRPFRRRESEGVPGVTLRVWDVTGVIRTG